MDGGGGMMADDRSSQERGREEKNMGERWHGLSRGWGVPFIVVLGGQHGEGVTPVLMAAIEGAGVDGSH
jgi:hypothetical protein